MAEPNRVAGGPAARRATNGLPFLGGLFRQRAVQLPRPLPNSLPSPLLSCLRGVVGRSQKSLRDRPAPVLPDQGGADRALVNALGCPGVTRSAVFGQHAHGPKRPGPGWVPAATRLEAGCAASPLPRGFGTGLGDAALREGGLVAGRVALASDRRGRQLDGAPPVEVPYFLRTFRKTTTRAIKMAAMTM